MAKNGFKVLDSDMHIVEPPDLWQRYIDPEFKDQAPIGLTERVGDLQMVHPDGRQWGRDPIAVQKNLMYAGHDHPKNEVRYKPYEDRGWTGEVQLGAMDEEGIDVAVLYPSRGLFALAIPDMDPRLAGALARAYNDWLYDFCEPDRSRLIGAGMISPFDVDDAVSETRRCVNELGFRGVLVRPNLVNNRHWHDPYYEPLWDTLEELGVPIGFHEAMGSLLHQVGERFGANTMLRHVFCHSVEQMMAASSFCAAGILENHPALRAAFLEGNCSWLPFLMWRLDEHWERVGDVHAPFLKMAPSGYWKRQCFASVEADEEPVKYVIDYMGNRGLLFSTDFPHLDAKFPASVDRFLEVEISDDDKRQILWDNCAEFYGIA